MSGSMSASDCVWHFIGNMHLPVYMSGDAWHYQGGADFATHGVFDFTPQPLDIRVSVDFGSESAQVQFQSLMRSGFGSGADYASQGPAPFVKSDALDSIIQPLPFYLSRPFGAGGAFASGPLDAAVTYTYGSNPAGVSLVGQSNFLDDGDLLTGEPGFFAYSAAVDFHPAQAGAVFRDLIAAVEDVLPESAADAVASLDVLKTQHVSISGDAVTFEGRGADAPSVDANGTYVNGARISEVGQSAADQIAEIEDIVESSLVTRGDDAGDDAPVGNGPMSAGDPPSHAEIETLLGQGTHIDQSVATGGNQSINAAVLVDAGEAFGSLVIEGDFHQTNLIVQINALADSDAVSFSGQLISVLIGADNATANEASFIREPGELYGNAVLQGFPGATDWHVEYNYGDLVDLSVLEQTNILRDGDRAEVTSNTSHVLMMLGENGQLNIINLSELGAQYDLIIIGGDYYKLNAILQINVLLDNDLLIADARGTDGAQSAAMSGNSLLNDAAIVDTGAASFKPLAGAPASLVAAIAAEDGDISGVLTIGLPGNGTPEFDVLYITGDYYDYNIISQTNVIYDADVLRLAVSGEEPPDSLTQDASLGGNAALNGALIVDVGSTSAYQYLGGDVFEDTMLIQADILIDDDSITYGDDGHAALDPDVVAAVAAMGDGEGSAADVPNAAIAAAELANSDGLASVMH